MHTIQILHIRVALRFLKKVGERHSWCEQGKVSQPSATKESERNNRRLCLNNGTVVVPPS